MSDGVTFLLTQVVVVPRLAWPPLRLLRAGILLALAGLTTAIFASTVPLMTAGISVVGIGFGLAVPGYSAGATLRVTETEQGALAGLMTATSALTFVVGPPSEPRSTSLRRPRRTSPAPHLSRCSWSSRSRAARHAAREGRVTRRE